MVTELISILGADAPLRVVERDEHLLLDRPHPSALPFPLWHDHDLLTVVHFSQQHQPMPFAPPRAAYENDTVRVEWQQMDDNRQPFYHRNTDVDEISYQIAGTRTLLTELGTVDHSPGDFLRIPRGVGHDNYGVRESHLLFYLPAPISEEQTPGRASTARFPPFPGWSPGACNEAVTECMGTPEHDITVFPVDERLLLGSVHAETERLHVLRGGPAELVWLYRGDHARLGVVTLPPSAGEVYRRTLDADEIQYQVRGRRAVVTQRGIVELEPGDLLRLPLGLAHTSITYEETEHVRLLCHPELTQTGPTARTAEPYTVELLDALRHDGPQAPASATKGRRTSARAAGASRAT